MKTKATLIIIFTLLGIDFTSCQSNTETPELDVAQLGTPVTATTISKNNLTETIELNATSAFLLKTPVKSVANGYLQKVIVKNGDFVNKGTTIMHLITKEAQSLGAAIDQLDTSFHFSGEINIVANGSGYISQLNYNSGDYVQDGEQLAIINDSKSFAFILDLPYELTPYLKPGKSVEVVLPDKTQLNAVVERSMPTVDAASQTQSYVLSVKSDVMIPENLVAKVLLIKSVKQAANSVPKSAVLADETQEHFWVMKMLNDTTAIKTIIQKGIENNDNVEILSPEFSASDRILISGNYGLPDTAAVRIQN